MKFDKCLLVKNTCVGQIDLKLAKLSCCFIHVSCSYLSYCVVLLYCRLDALVDSLTQQTGIPQSHMELFFDNHPFKPPTTQVKDLPITTVSISL